MKHTKIYSSEVIHKDKTLDKFLEEGGEGIKELPVATESQLGCVTIGGSPLRAEEGDLQLDYDGDTLTLNEDNQLAVPIASSNNFGVIKVGSGLTITNGVLSASGGSGEDYTIIASYGEFTRDDDSSITGFARYSKEITSSEILNELKTLDIKHPEKVILKLYSSQAAIDAYVRCSSIIENTNSSTKWRSFLFATTSQSNKKNLVFYTIYINWT